MTPRYSDLKLLNDLKLKYKALGRLPKRRELDGDENMANSSTYYDRFGSIGRAIELIDISTEKPCELSLGLFAKYAKEFYATRGRSPKTTDFDTVKGFPHSCYIREVCRMSWNEFLKYCDLPIYDYSDDLGISKLRKVSLRVIKILENRGYDAEDMGELTYNSAIQIIINQNIKLSLKTSGIRKDQGMNYWKFHVRNNSVIEPDLLVLIGFKTDDFSDEGNVFVVPFKDVRHLKTISVNVDRLEKSKYFKYYSGSLKELRL